MRGDNDDPDEYLSDAERIDRLRAEVAVLQARVADLDRRVRETDITGLQVEMAVLQARVDDLDRQLRELDVAGLRVEMAVLRTRIDALADFRESAGVKLGRLTFYVLCVLAVAAANLAATLTAGR